MKNNYRKPEYSALEYNMQIKAEINQSKRVLPNIERNTPFEVKQLILIILLLLIWLKNNLNHILDLE